MNSRFEGSVGSYVILTLTNAILVSLTLGIATPWAIVREYRWRYNNQVIDGKRLVFEGRGGDLFGKFIIWVLLIIITLGIYVFWVARNLERWRCENTRLIDIAG